MVCLLKNFLFGGDDTEYTIRLSNALPCFLVSKSHVVHMRKMLEGLSFITESEPHRLRLYYYMFRNQFYIARKGYWRKRLPILRYLYTKIALLLKTIVNLKFLHSWILVRAIGAAFFFSPTIKYPNRND